MVRLLLGLLFACTAAAGLVPEALEERESFASKPHATLDRYLSVPMPGADEGRSGKRWDDDELRREGENWLANDEDPGDVVNAEVDGLLDKMKIAKGSKEYMDDGGKLIKVMEQRIGKLNDDELMVLEDEREKVDVYVLGDDDPLSSSILSQVFRAPIDALTIPAVPINHSRSVLAKNTTSPEPLNNVTSKPGNGTSQNITSPPENITSGPLNITSSPVNTSQTTTPPVQNQTSPASTNESVPTPLPHTISFPITKNTPPPDQRSSIVESSQFQNITSTQTKSTSQPQVLTPPSPQPSRLPYTIQQPIPKPVPPPTQHPTPIPMQIKFFSPQPTPPPQRPLPTQAPMSPTQNLPPRPVQTIQFPPQQRIPPSPQIVTIQTRPVSIPPQPVTPQPNPTSPPPLSTSPPRLSTPSSPQTTTPPHPVPLASQPVSVHPKTPSEHPIGPLKDLSHEPQTSPQGPIHRDALQESQYKDAKSHYYDTTSGCNRGQDTTNCCQPCMCNACKERNRQCHS